jgi:predicted Zn-dependent protease
MCTVHMRVPIRSAFFVVALCICVGGAARAQQSCSVAVPIRIPTAANIFSAQQERALGDIEAEMVESSYHTTRDQELAVHLNAVVSRVQSQLPHDKALVHVILIDAPEAQSFSVSPERIYVSRKMVALLRNDDELAGLLGHELGHILAHQNATIVTQLFHEILGVNAVSDRKDISEKLLRVFSGIDHDKKLLTKTAQIMGQQEGIEQKEADRVALYASAAAGFSPQAYVELFDRAAGTNGSSGSILTDFFGTSTSDLRRFREIKKALKRLPRPCREIAPVVLPEFRTWQAAVTAGPDLARR